MMLNFDISAFLLLFKVDRPQTTVVAKNLSVLQLFISILACTTGFIGSLQRNARDTRVSLVLLQLSRTPIVRANTNFQHIFILSLNKKFR